MGIGFDGVPMDGRLGEFDRIRRFLRPLADGAPAALDLGDDAAALDPPPGERLVITTDAMVESVHYLAGEVPDRLARKLLRVNLSDLAAMGARPLAYTLTTALNDVSDEAWLEAFARGLADDQAGFGISLIGGDSVSTSGPVVLSICAIGAVAPDRLLRRNGARPGDVIWVSGWLGDAALGLRLEKGEVDDAPPDPAQRAYLCERFHLPSPRLDLGAALGGLATAAMDVSDGLIGDLAHICRQSAVGAEVDLAAVPLSSAARDLVSAAPRLQRIAWSGGDDYELLFTAAPGQAERVQRAAAASGVPVTPIGRIVEGTSVSVVGGPGEAAALAGWTHF